LPAMKVSSRCLLAASVASRAAAVDWTVLQDQNAVYGTDPGVTPGVLLPGKTETWQECQALTEKLNATIFTWHDANQGSFANDCVVRTDHVFQLTPESGHVAGVLGSSSATFDCAMRKYAYEFGQQLIPRQGDFPALYWALNLNGSDAVHCNVTPPTAAAAAARSNSQKQATTTKATIPMASSSIVKSVEDLPADAVFVCALSGNDAAVGSVDAPLRSLPAATERALGTASRMVVLRGTANHFLQEQLVLTPRHSNLTIVSYPGENAVVSGGVELKVSWAPFKTTGGSNIYVADVSGQVKTVPGLQLDGARATRARYPNIPGGIEVSCGYGCMISGDSAAWTPPNLNRFGPVTFYTDSNPEHDRNDTAEGWFTHYMIGIHGLCSVCAFRAALMPPRSSGWVGRYGTMVGWSIVGGAVIELVAGGGQGSPVPCECCGSRRTLSLSVATSLY
jgi:hypothetical protein